MTPNQGDFFTTLDARRQQAKANATAAAARLSDPATSKEAAASVTTAKRTALQQRILRALTVLGPMDDQALHVAVNNMEKALSMPPSSPSGVRSRRSELSKPNMARIDTLKSTWYSHNTRHEHVGNPEKFNAAAEAWARKQLAIEGWRSPVVAVDHAIINGRRCLVWGLASEVKP